MRGKETWSQQGPCKFCGSEWAQGSPEVLEINMNANMSLVCSSRCRRSNNRSTHDLSYCFFLGLCLNHDNSVCKQSCCMSKMPHCVLIFFFFLKCTRFIGLFVPLGGLLAGKEKISMLACGCLLVVTDVEY